MELKINETKIGDKNKVFIIAELSANRCQNFDLAVETIKAMKDSGADVVKLQVYTADTMTEIPQRIFHDQTGHYPEQQDFLPALSISLCSMGVTART